MTDVCIGLTTWNDAEFIKRSIPALQRSLAGIDYDIIAWDNASIDHTIDVLRACGVSRIIRKRCAQGDALNGLLAASTAPYTLLMHSDVFLLAPNWFPHLRAALQRSGSVLISPEDTGQGNMRRAAFAGMPESSFMLFDTAKARQCLEWLPVPLQLVKNLIRYRYIYSPHRFNFDVNHITHAMPGVFARRGLQWLPMRPLPSTRLDTPWFTREGEGVDTEMGRYDYGDGNFYIFEGMVTHYHNWLARYLGPNARPLDKIPTTFHAYGEGYTQRFINDFDAGTVRLPPLSAD
ncbi:MAG TPA: glycosyltransferase [Armatimonadota bacterium]|jgi:glycosyltransferase involved in cell wall biosynthesis